MSKLSGRRVPDQLEIAEAWDKLRGAIERVETAGPFRMTADIENLRAQRQIFEDVVLGRPALQNKDESNDL